MTKTNEQTAVKTRAAKAAKADAAPKADAPEAEVPAKRGKVLTESDFSFPTEKQIKAEAQAGIRAEVAKGAHRADSKAQLARGIAAKDAQHSAKAVADQNRAAKPTNKADAATQKPKAAKAEVAKAAKAERAEAADARSLVATEKGKAKIAKAGKEDRLAKIVAAKTVAKALASGITRGDINYAARCGLIELN